MNTPSYTRCLSGHDHRSQFVADVCDRREDRRFQAALSAAVRATGSGCTGFTEIDGHSHYMNGTCDDETPYRRGGPA